LKLELAGGKKHEELAGVELGMASIFEQWMLALACFDLFCYLPYRITTSNVKEKRKPCFQRPS